MNLLRRKRAVEDNASPDLHFESYEWGEIVFDFYDGWLEDVRSCAHGLKDYAEGQRPCPPAERLFAALRSVRGHGDESAESDD